MAYFATVGDSAESAVKAAVMTEDNAAIVWTARQLGAVLPIPRSRVIWRRLLIRKISTVCTIAIRMCTGSVRSTPPLTLFSK